MNHEFPETSAGADGCVKPLWGDLSGIWPDPSTSAGNARQDIVADIAKYMAINGMPSIVTDSKENLVDLASILAGKMMDNSASGGTTPEAPALNWTTFNYKDPAAKLEVEGRHAYYRIPLASNGQRDAWHSYIRLKYTQSPTAQQSFVEEKKKHAPAKGKTPPPTPYNSTTITATWTTGLGTSRIMSEAKNTLGAAPLNWYVGPPATDLHGSYTYVIYTPPTVAPATVKQSLSDAINQAMPKPEMTAAANVAPPALPTLMISNSSTVISATT